MKKLIVILSLLLGPASFFAQDFLSYNGASLFSFKSCDKGGSETTTCSNEKLKSIIQQAILPQLTAASYVNKSNTKLITKIDATGKMVWAIFSFSDQNGSQIQDLKTDKVSLEGITLSEDIFVTCTLDKNAPKSILNLITNPNAQFMVVEKMPTNEFCTTSRCLEQWILEQITQKIKLNKSDLASGEAYTVSFELTIEQNGRIDQILQTAKIPDHIQKIIDEAISQSGLLTTRFTPGSQRGEPVSIFMKLSTTLRR